ncbi:hypothetical protein Pan216_36160 [Planctomycetes bacterium Pan216]|uniref:Uncharacterized protein n=1 Tax=Kolteria novifilia TaxID=2527975 RepID=A0A518B710_9BACT|nr:hypothetical protein Pan216_36160 [Planctomycetes bacterium Pan216]
MESAAWQKVFHSIRPEDIRDLMIILNGGIEVVVQEICHVEDELVMLRGRPGGQDAAGRLFLIPFTSINNIYVNREVKEIEIDLYSPSVPEEEKIRISKRIEELEREALEEAKNAEKEAANSKVDPDDIRRQLEELRKASGFKSDAKNDPPPMPQPLSSGDEEATKDDPKSKFSKFKLPERPKR